VWRLDKNKLQQVTTIIKNLKKQEFVFPVIIGTRFSKHTNTLSDSLLMEHHTGWQVNKQRKDSQDLVGVNFECNDLVVSRL
jgi:hypothetical protein